MWILHHLSAACEEVWTMSEMSYFHIIHMYYDKKWRAAFTATRNICGVIGVIITCHMLESECSAPPLEGSWHHHTCHEFSAQLNHLLASTGIKIETNKMSRPLIISMPFAWPSCKWSVPGGWRCRVWAFCWLVCSCTTDMRISSTPGGVTNGAHDGEDASSKQANHFKYANAQLTNEYTS